MLAFDKKYSVNIIEGYGLSVSQWLPLEMPASDSTRRYLKTKKEKLGHRFRSV